MLGLVFQVGADKVAVDVCRVREVVPRVRLTVVHGVPPWIAGVFVYRGRVVPVVDLHALAGVGECPPHLSSRIILFPYPLVRSCFLADVLLNGPTQMRQPEILPAMKHSSPPPNKSRSRTSKERKDLSPTGNLFLGHKLAGELRILMRLSSSSNPPSLPEVSQGEVKSY